MARKKFTFKYYPVYYAWLENGVEKRASTMIEALTREDASKKFAKDNPHVLVVSSTKISNDPSFRSNLACIIHERQIA